MSARALQITLRRAAHGTRAGHAARPHMRCNLTTCTTTTTTTSIRPVWKTRAAVFAAVGGASFRSVWSTPTTKRALCSASVTTSAATSAVKPAAHVDDMEILLYQYQICPFCNKIKSFLDYYGLKYSTIEVNPLSKEEIKTNLSDQTDYKKVPICVINGEVVCDSSVIMRKLQSMLADRNVLLKEHRDGSGSGEEGAAGEVVWTEWVDKSLAVLLFPNITRNFPESWQAFSYISNIDTFTLTQRYANRVLGSSSLLH